MSFPHEKMTAEMVAGKRRCGGIVEDYLPAQPLSRSQLPVDSLGHTPERYIGDHQPGQELIEPFIDLQILHLQPDIYLGGTRAYLPDRPLLPRDPSVHFQSLSA